MRMGPVHSSDLPARDQFQGKMDQYTFFHYEVNEALHISEEESVIIKDCVDKIESGIQAVYRQAYPTRDRQ